MVELINRDWNSSHVTSLKKMFNQVSHFYRVSDDNDCTITFGTLVRIFCHSNLFVDGFTLDTLVKLAQRYMNPRDRIFADFEELASPNKKTENADPAQIVSDLHYKKVCNKDVVPLIKAKFVELKEQWQEYKAKEAQELKDQQEAKLKLEAMTPEERQQLKEQEAEEENVEETKETKEPSVFKNIHTEAEC